MVTGLESLSRCNGINSACQIYRDTASNSSCKGLVPIPDSNWNGASSHRVLNGYHPSTTHWWVYGTLRVASICWSICSFYGKAGVCVPHLSIPLPFMHQQHNMKPLPFMHQQHNMNNIYSPRLACSFPLFTMINISEPHTTCYNICMEIEDHNVFGASSGQNGMSDLMNDLSNVLKFVMGCWCLPYFSAKTAHGVHINHLVYNRRHLFP